MELNIYKLHFTTPLHLSNESEDYAQSLHTLHSDTMYAAINSALAKVGYKFNENFDGDLGFTASSLFPFYQEKKETNAIYFFPKSKKTDILADEVVGFHKYIKKIKWMDTFFFEKHLRNEDLESFYQKKITLKNGKEELKHIKGSYLTNDDKLPKDFISAQVFPHAKVPRQQIINGEKQDTQIYYMERLFFKGCSGMYFIAEGNTTLLEKGLNILQHEGIGTDRNVGNGFFEWTKESIELDMPSQAEYAMNLSLFLPEKEEQLMQMFDGNVAYSFKKRGGWVTTHPHNTIRKNRIHMFEEGSIFKKKVTETVIAGQIADLTPELPEAMKIDHHIYRNGKSLFIPITINNNKENNG